MGGDFYLQAYLPLGHDLSLIARVLCAPGDAS